MTIHVVHYLDGTSEEFPPVAEYVNASTTGWSDPKYLGGGPGPGGGGVVTFTWWFNDPNNAKSKITIPLMRVHHIEEREVTQADYDRYRS